MRARVWTGTRDEAVEFAAQRNAKHGLKRNKADLRKVVSMLIALPEWADKGDREIARHCGISHPTVAAIRAELSGKRSSRCGPSR